MSGTLRIADLLQGDTWRDATGTVTPIAELEVRHARNILRYLERRVEFDVVFYCALHDLAAQIGEEWQLVADPVGYVRSLPTYVALENHVRSAA